MFILKKIKSLPAILLVSSALLSPVTAFAQDISEEHLKAAKRAISALQVTVSFDNILPNSAVRIKGVLIEGNPNFSDEISAAVDDEAIKLASRRADLENEAGLIYAKKFTLEELNAIADFYESDIGKKLLQQAPITARELVRAAEIWGSGINRDLGQNANKALTEKLSAQKPTDN